MKKVSDMLILIINFVSLLLWYKWLNVWTPNNKKMFGDNLGIILKIQNRFSSIVSDFLKFKPKLALHFREREE